MNHFSEDLFMKPLVMGIGELLWDVLPGGPEMGGAPANFACHARSLGLDAAVVSAVGDDPDGRRLIAMLAARGVETAGIAVRGEWPTGIVSVALDDDGQPEYTIRSGVAWDHFVAGARQMELAVRADAVCFGTLAQRDEESAQALRTLVRAVRPEALKVLDLNLRPPFYDREVLEVSLELANIVKLNEGELDEISRLFGLEGGVKRRLSQMVERWELRGVAYTRGASGCLLHDGRGWGEQPGCVVKAVDTVGAGDSFTAAVVAGWLREVPLDEIARAANEIAAFVCSRPGATPELPVELKGWLGVNGVPAEA